MDKIKIAVLGLGTVGQGVVMLLNSRSDLLASRAGSVIELKKVLEKYLTKKRDVVLPDGMCTNRWEEIVNDPDIDIIVETIGGIEPARTYVLEALAAGKSVVTANNDLMAEHGAELLRAAKQAGKDLYFENSVGGAIPLIRALRQNLSASNLNEIMGIINGTTNYILTRMGQGQSFERALMEAREMGITEPDPRSDIEGYDASRSAAILATLAFHNQVSFSDVFVEGISDVTMDDISTAKSLGYAVKLLAVCRSDGEAIEARVHPALLPESHPLSSVKDMYYAIYIKGEELGETMFYGLGAGRLPSAIAVLDDVIAVANNIRAGCQGRLTYVEPKTLPILPMEKTRTRYFLRLSLTDEKGALARVAEILGNHRISIARVHQKALGNGTAEIVFITHLAIEGDVWEAVSRISQLDITQKVLTLLRVEGDHRDN